MIRVGLVLVVLLALFLITLAVGFWRKHENRVLSRSKIAKELLTAQQTLASIENDARVWQNEEPYLANRILRHFDAPNRKEL